MNKFATGYMGNKDDTSPENVKSSFDGSLSDNPPNEDREEMAGRNQMEEEKGSTQRNGGHARLEKSERTEFSISQTQNQTAIQYQSLPRVEEKKRIDFSRLTAIEEDPNSKILEEIKAQQFMTEKDYALIEKLFKVSEETTVLSKDEVDTVRELLLCSPFISICVCVDVTDIVGDHILEDANIQMIAEKIGKGVKTTSNITIKRYEGGEEVGELKENAARLKKRVKELESYSDSLQAELTAAQDKLMAEMEEKNKVKSFAGKEVSA